MTQMMVRLSVDESATHMNPKKVFAKIEQQPTLKGRPNDHSTSYVI